MCTFCGKPCPFTDDAGLLEVRELCAREGIELQGEEGHPFHCGERMQTKVGILGVDYARCQTCELTIGRPISPHINGGKLFIDQVMEDHASAWMVLCPGRELLPGGDA